MGSVSFIVAPTDGSLRRLVIARNASIEFRDRIDTNLASARRKFLDTVAKKMGLSPEEAERVRDEWEDRLVALADEADRQADKIAAEAAQTALDPREIAIRELKETPAGVIDAAERMAANPNLLQEVYDDLATLGIAGEYELTMTTFLVGISRLLSKPLACVVVGPTSTGKSHILKTVGRLFPEEAVYLITEASRNAWYYLPPGSLKHRFVIMGERAQGETPEVIDANKAIRELLSEGVLRKAVPFKTASGTIETYTITQEGPIALAESTTKTRLLDEDASRLILLNSDDSPEQTKEVIESVCEAAERTREPHVKAILDKHHAYQRLLARDAKRVIVPYATKLAKKFPTERPECRRIIHHVLGMIQACALAHIRQREMTNDCIVATLSDYKVACRLLHAPAARLLDREPHKSAQRLLSALYEKYRSNQFSTRDAEEVGNLSRRGINENLKRLAEAGFVERITPPMGPNPATWRVVSTEWERDSILPTAEEIAED